MSVAVPSYQLSIWLTDRSKTGLAGQISKPPHDVMDRFDIDPGEVNKSGESLRDALLEWAAVYSDGDDDKIKRWHVLVNKAGRGFDSVFRYSQKISRILQDAPPNLEIVVDQDYPGLKMPWGLLCSPDDVDAAKADPLRPLLWAAKHNLRVVVPVGGMSDLRQAGWRFHPVLCQTTYDKGVRMLPDCATPLAQSIVLRQHNPQVKVKDVGTAPNCFMYIHAHSQSENGGFVIKREGHSDEVYSGTELLASVLPNKGKDSGAAVAVLNACATVGPFVNMAEGIVMQNDYEVACIATEIAVNGGFAMRFGLELIDRCVERGESTMTAMRELRRTHYPMSVIYSHHALADVAVSPPISIFAADHLQAYRASLAQASVAEHTGVGQ